AITWNLLTWWFGIPSSSSHTLIGGFAGAAIISSCSFSAVHLELVIKIASFIDLAPFIGMILAIIFTTCIFWICRKANPHKANKCFKRFSWSPYSLYSDIRRRRRNKSAVLFSLVIIDRNNHSGGKFRLNKSIG
ncbi:hypothetical protein EZS27_043982, partial [termite gut metagenome]